MNTIEPKMMRAYEYNGNILILVDVCVDCGDSTEKPTQEELTKAKESLEWQLEEVNKLITNKIR
jgi:hypothetical protein